MKVLGLTFRIVIVLLMIAFFLQEPIKTYYVNHFKVDFRDISGEYAVIKYKSELAFFNCYGSESLSSEDGLVIAFEWQPYEDLNPTPSRIPMSLVKFTVEKEKAIPTVEFVFEEFRKKYKNPIYLGDGAYRLNQFLMLSPLRAIHVRISENQLQKECVPNSIKKELGIKIDRQPEVNRSKEIPWDSKDNKDIVDL